MNPSFSGDKLKKRLFLCFFITTIIMVEIFLWTHSEIYGFLAIDGWHGQNIGRTCIIQYHPFEKLTLALQTPTYLYAHLGFNGYPNAVINSNNKMQERILFPFLTKSFWFLGPLLSAWFLNILFWILSCFYAFAIMKAITSSKSAPIIALILTAVTSGFLVFFIEPLPYMLSIATGFFILGVACHLRLWSHYCPFINHLLVYLIIGILSLNYASSFLYLPIICAFTFVWSVQRKLFRKTVIGVFERCSLQLFLRNEVLNVVFSMLIGLSVIVFIVFSMVYLPIKIYLFIINADNLIQAVHLSSVLTQSFSKLPEIFYRQDLLLMAIFSYGPFLLIAGIIGFISSIFKKSYFVFFAGIFLSVQLMICMLTHLISVKSYALFIEPAVLWIVISSYGLSVLWNSRKSALKIISAIMLLGCILWPNMPLVGYKQPFYMYSIGIKSFTSDEYHMDYKTYFFK